MSKSNNIKALKSGVWYTATNFITKSIGFITTPIFTRLLSHNDFGLYSNYNSWLVIFTVFATLNLGSSFISARYDHEENFDGYVFSTLTLSSIVTVALAAVFNLFPSVFTDITGLELRHLNIMVVYLLLFSAVELFQARERYYYKYKVSAATSIIIAVSTALLSVFLVVTMDNKLDGRIIGSALPTIIAGVLLYIVIIKRGKRVNVSYWKYALPICLPFIPHALSLFLLNSMDKIMITKMCGAEDNALYSVAYSCGAAITMLVTSMNTAFSPWLGEKLHFKKYSEILKVSKYYILLFVFFACGIMLLTPELLLILGGSSYYEAVNVMPPVAFGCVCQFMYTLYVNVEQYNKKTIGMAFASIIAAVSNFVLNAIFIPQFGYIAAAYTTLASFAILLFIHMGLVKRMGLTCLYPSKLIFAVLILMTVYMTVLQILFMNNMIRYIIIIIYIVFAIIVIVKYKDKIKRLFGK